MIEVYPHEATSQQKKLYFDSRFYLWDEPYFCKHGANRVITRSILEYQAKQMLSICHLSPYGGHHRGERVGELCSKMLTLLLKSVTNVSKW